MRFWLFVELCIFDIWPTRIFSRTTMRKKLYLLLLMVLISSNLSVGEDSNKTEHIKVSHKNPSKSHLQTKANADRNKRSLDEEEAKPFWANRGKKQSEENYIDTEKYKINSNILRNEKNSEEPPFWGNRGRRDSSSVENYIDDIDFPISKAKLYSQRCKYCLPFPKILGSNSNIDNFKNRRDEILPFWGNRGRRNSDEVENDDDIRDSSPFWGNRGRRQEDDPFWGARGRREEEPFWGNRGRRESLPFGVNTIKRNKGREEEYLEEEDPFWGNRGRRTDFKESIQDAINDVQEEIAHAQDTSNPVDDSKIKTSFWSSKGRDSSLQHLFNGSPRQKNKLFPSANKALIKDRNHAKLNTLNDGRIYAEEPHYIVVERSSRSSGEVDPYYISRGKKVNLYGIDLEKAARDRRNVIKDIVKSVKTDPYFIVRGKKAKEKDTKADNSTVLHYKYAKAKDLICATVNIMLMKKGGSNYKRESPDSDRGRRAILNKLAAQLQIDPYFVSRGKKSNDWTNRDEYLAEFLDQVAEMCN